METFGAPRDLVVNHHYSEQRQKCLEGLSLEVIDAPIAGIVKGFNTLPHCFTMQSCYGHFIYGEQTSRYNLDPLPVELVDTEITYRIAYIAFCIEYSHSGIELLEKLKKITLIDSEYIQFGSADWFWENQVNSYVLQVEPIQYRHQDTALLSYKEALYTEKIRNAFFDKLNDLTREGQHM